MKKFLFSLILSAACVAAFSQQVVTDSITFFYSQEKSIFIQLQKIAYSSGATSIHEVPIGDSTAFKAYLLNRAQDEYNYIAAVESARLLLTENRRKTVEYINMFTSVFNLSLVTEIRERYKTSFIGEWRYRDISAGSTIQTIQIVAHPTSGVLRIDFGGEIGFKNLRVLSDNMFTLINFPTQGVNTDFVKISSSRFGPNSTEFRSTTGNYLIGRREQ